MSVVSIRMVVDLPAPLGPRKPKTSPVVDLQVDAAHGFDRAASACVVLDELFSFHRKGHGWTLSWATDVPTRPPGLVDERCSP